MPESANAKVGTADKVAKAAEAPDTMKALRESARREVDVLTAAGTGRNP